MPKDQAILQRCWKLMAAGIRWSSFQGRLEVLSASFQWRSVHAARCSLASLTSWPSNFASRMTSACRMDSLEWPRTPFSPACRRRSGSPDLSEPPLRRERPHLWPLSRTSRTRERGSLHGRTWCQPRTSLFSRLRESAGEGSGMRAVPANPISTHRTEG